MRVLLPLTLFLSAASALPTETPTTTQNGVTAHNWTAPDGSIKTIYVGGLAHISEQNLMQKRVTTLDYSKLISKDACGHSSFTSVTTAGSPRVSDCQAIQDWVYSQGGGFATSVDPHCDTYCEFVWHGTCKFGVRWNGVVQLVVGSTDVGDLIRDSIRMYQWNGYVGAEGTMSCQNFSTTKWAIFHA